MYSIPSKPSRLQLTAAQIAAIHVLESNEAHMLIAPTGSGKTAIGVHAVSNYLTLNPGARFIIAAPPKVLSHWPAEARKWGLTEQYAVLDGSAPQRLKLALDPANQILVISLNSLDWLLAQDHKATGIIIDELSKAAGKQSRGLRLKRSDAILTRWGFTATPVSENFQKLYGMLRIIDKGARLGTRKDAYLQKYFYPTDYKQYNWALKLGQAEVLLKKIADVVHIVPYNKSDFVPDVQEYVLPFTMPEATRDAYDLMKKDLVLPEASAVAANLAVMSSKLRQLASGFVIDEEGTAKEFDTERTERVLKWASDLDGRKGLIIYEYDYQRDQIEGLIFGLDYVVSSGATSTKEALQQFKADTQILVAQYQTLSHGVDGLQAVCHDILFVQPIWSRDATEQTIGRLHRQGQTKVVNVNYVIADNSIDEIVLDRIDGKEINMQTFMQHLAHN